MRVLLDSTVLIDYLKDKPVADRVDALAQSEDRPCTTVINVEEVVRGLRTSEEGRARDLFEGLELLEIGVEEGWRAGEWRREYARQGRTLWQADCLIAAAAYSAHAVVATGNPLDFPMESIDVEHWPVGG